MIRCASCGRFIAYKDLAAGKFYFEPSSHFGPEITEWECKECAAKEAERVGGPRMDERDCIYPDCLIKTDFGSACEHSCQYEAQKRAEREEEVAGSAPRPFRFADKKFAALRDPSAIRLAPKILRFFPFIRRRDLENYACGGHFLVSHGQSPGPWLTWGCFLWW